MKPGISDDALKVLTDSEIRASMAYMGGRLSEQRRRNEYFYLGLPKGELAPPGIDGRSSVVDTSVRDTVEWMLTSIVKIFTAGDKAVEFAPRTQRDEQAAKQATDYINYVFQQQNEGYKVLTTAIKDALIQKAGIIKCWWDDTVEDVREEYKCLSIEQVTMLMQEDDVEIIEQSAYPDPNAPQIDPAALGIDPAMMPTPMMYDIAIKRVVSRGRVRIEAVPPEEFLISRRAKSIEEAPFVAHRVEKTISDLKAAGYKNVDRISSDEAAAATMNSERIERRAWDDELPYLPNVGDASADPSQRVVWLTECYVRADRNGDGIAEWLKVVRAGPAVLEVEECDGPPFVAIVPIPLPHRFFGLALADLLIQAQMTKTSLLRAALDNFYIGVNGRYFAVEGQVNLDDLLTTRPGGVVRVKQPGMVGRLDAGVGDIGGALTMLEYTETQKENASGWTRYSQGTSADALNKTATGTSIITNRSDARVELMARNIAESGVKRLFLLILKLVSQYQDKPATLRLTDGWVDIDPREWKTQFDLVVNVGIGTGNKDQIVGKLMNLHAMQMQGAQAGIVTPQNLYNGATKVVEAMGFKQPEMFFSDPTKMPPKPPAPPPPEVLKLQMDAQAKQAQMQADMQAQAAKLQADAQKLQAEMQLAYEKMRADLQIEREKLEAEVLLKRELAAMQIGADRESQLYAQLVKQQEAQEAAEAAQAAAIQVRPKRRIIRHHRGDDGRIAASEVIEVDDDQPEIQ